MFYNDRFGDRESGFLDRLLAIGKMFDPARIQAISAEAFGSRDQRVASDDVGLILPGREFKLSRRRGSGGLAAFGFR